MQLPEEVLVLPLDADGCLEPSSPSSGICATSRVASGARVPIAIPTGGSENLDLGKVGLVEPLDQLVQQSPQVLGILRREAEARPDPLGDVGDPLPQ